MIVLALVIVGLLICVGVGLELREWIDPERDE